ncbi:CoA transferase [Ornithinimicrobium kibberense]|uniref:CoA transferase n=1 Tax=Ornithinimicrobium kibberense TaxID=282060 RepID=A0ABV5V2P9_9MICO|nr:CoA transferase [Ornithinimicrobium kibberense]
MTLPDDPPLQGTTVVTVAVNLPGPLAAARLAGLGAQVTTVLPPGGDPLEHYQPDWYADLHRGQELVTLDLKREDARERLDTLLADADVLITSSRPSALRRLGLDFGTLHERHPRLCQVDVVGSPGRRAELPGHDLTYQAAVGLVRPPHLPATLAADLHGAERAVGEALAALLRRTRTGVGSRREVALEDAAAAMAEPAVRGLTAPGGLLGGGLPGYAVYPAAEGHVALAALEPHFLRRTAEALGVETTHEAFAEVFSRRTAQEWATWAAEHDVPLSAVSAPWG